MFDICNNAVIVQCTETKPGGVYSRRVTLNHKDSKTNQDLAFFYARIDALQIGSYERIKAKAELARTEAIADAMVAFGRGARGLLKTLIVHPFRRFTASIG
jgi:hypothetical protein